MKFSNVLEVTGKTLLLDSFFIFRLFLKTIFTFILLRMSGKLAVEIPLLKLFMMNSDNCNSLL